MAIDVGVHAVASHASSATTAGVTTSATGSFYIGVSCSTGAFTSIADNKGNSANYIQIGTTRSSSGHEDRLYLCTNGSGGAGHTATAVGSAVTCYFGEITSGLTAGLLDQNNGGVDAVAPFGDALTITTLQNDELILAITGSDAAGTVTYTPSGGFVTVDAETDGNNFWSTNLHKRVVSATGTYATSVTVSAGVTDVVVLIASFKAAGGGAVATSGPTPRCIYIMP